MLSRVLRGFSAAPYNPMRYLRSYVPTELPTKAEIFDTINTAFETGGIPVNNLRHINPIRQSGAVPAFDGPFTMEDIVDNCHQEYAKLGDRCYVSTDTEEIMRRVPGTTREEAEYIRTLGLTPDDEVELAYYAKSIGLDIYYPFNYTYIARQVVTNSKGEKTEVLWPFTSWEDCLELSVDTALQDLPYYTIRHWEAYSGDEWYKYVNNQDLGVPDTWYEYEKNSRFTLMMIEDQNEELPDTLRPWNTPRHPHCREELYQDQARLRELEEIAKPEWKHRSPDD
jgi:hypothetical protein